MSHRTQRAIAALTAAALAGAAGCSRNKSPPELEAPPSQTATPTSGIVQVTRQEIQSRRDQIVAQALPLSPAQGQKFWPLYREYRNEVQKLNDRNLGILGYFGRQGGALNDKESKNLLGEYLRVQKDKVGVQEDYAKKFEEVLPATSVARFFQLENKMDAAVAYDLAGAVPLIERAPEAAPAKAP